MKILSNQVVCLTCGDKPYSAHRHDLKYCKCRTIGVDGGMDYLRRLGDGMDLEDISITITDSLYEDLVETIKWAKVTDRNDLGLICAFFRKLRDHGVLKNTDTTPGQLVL